ncbi:MAG: hypothetical protein IJ658_04790 [Kiritimatiellae bacterium]|nr:hypothetical protein [Kiritimatiellia bacterium]
MAALRTALVKRRHAYTSADIPWAMDVDALKDAGPGSADQVKWRLFRYLSGGGMRAFGRSSGHELLIRRQTRFLWLAGALAVCWILFCLV